jgi:cytochrome c-type biogenesis protein CcmE
MTRKQRRLVMVGTALSVVGIAMGLVLFALRSSIVFFYVPSDLVAKKVETGTRIRLGGLVKTGSVAMRSDAPVRFEITDKDNRVAVKFSGLLPDLFREGQGVVAEGVLELDGTFKADNVLAKHDETYMPREVADALKKQGVWKGDDAAPAGAK